MLPTRCTCACCSYEPPLPAIDSCGESWATITHAILLLLLRLLLLLLLLLHDLDLGLEHSTYPHDHYHEQKTVYLYGISIFVGVNLS